VVEASPINIVEMSTQYMTEELVRKSKCCSNFAEKFVNETRQGTPKGESQRTVAAALGTRSQL
jgi:hypothetical protein